MNKFYFRSKKFNIEKLRKESEKNQYLKSKKQDNFKRNLIKKAIKFTDKKIIQAVKNGKYEVSFHRDNFTSKSEFVIYVQDTIEKHYLQYGFRIVIIQDIFLIEWRKK